MLQVSIRLCNRVHRQSISLRIQSIEKSSIYLYWRGVVLNTCSQHDHRHIRSCIIQSPHGVCCAISYSRCSSHKYYGSQTYSKGNSNWVMVLTARQDNGDSKMGTDIVVQLVGIQGHHPWSSFFMLCWTSRRRHFSLASDYSWTRTYILEGLEWMWWDVCSMEGWPFLYVHVSRKTALIKVESFTFRFTFLQTILSNHPRQVEYGLLVDWYWRMTSLG